jgi:ankyrin repeat protein
MNSKEFINISIVHSSLKYLKTFNLVIKLSRWIYEELIKINYNDLKLEKILEKRDLELIKESGCGLEDKVLIIHLNVDKNILNEHLIKYYDNYELIKLLLENGANVHVNNDNSLIYASNYGYVRIVKLLLEYGANVHVYNDCPLRLASRFGYDKVVKLLLEYGADIHANNNEALRRASERGHNKVIELLKEYMRDS